MAPDEIYGARPVVREGLEHLRAASQAKDCVDLTQQQPSAEELERALHAPEGEVEVDPDRRGKASNAELDPLPMLEAMELDAVKIEPGIEFPPEATLLQEEVDQHMTPHETRLR